MRYVLASLLAAVTFATAAPTVAAIPAPEPGLAPAFTATLDSLATRADRTQAASRLSRQYQRGGASRWGDSGHPLWAKAPSWARSFGLCVRRHESLTSGHYRAENPVSTASGAYQFLDSTWRGIAYWAKWDGQHPGRRYARASAAPAWVQDLVFVHAVVRGGQRHWAGTGCGYGT